MADLNESGGLKFGIEQTMELGDASFLDGIDAEETGNETLSPIDKTPEKKQQSPPAEKNEENEQKEEAPDASEIVSNFLSDNEDEDEDSSVEKKPPTKKVEPKEEEEESKETSQFEALAKDLFKLGVFNKEEDEEDDVEIHTAEDFLERFNVEKKKGAIEIVNNFIGQFGEDYQQAFEAIYVKGVNPREYFEIYNNIASFAQLDVTKESNQEVVMRKALADQGFEDEDIQTEIERLKSYGDLETVAAKHHKILVKKEAVKLKEAETKAETDLKNKMAFKEQYKQNVSAVLQEKLKAKEFDGIPLNPKLVTELQDFLLVDRWKTASGETLTDFDRTLLELKKPENHQMKVKIALLFKILEKDPTLSTIQKSGVTKQTDSLFKEVARHSSSKGKTGNSQGIGKDVFASYL